MGNIGLLGNAIINRVKELIPELQALPDDERVEVINQIKLAMHDISPLRDEPVDCVLWVDADTVQANNYNPNTVAPPEMRLLELSIAEDGFTQPIVTWAVDGHREVVDGFHRNRVGKESKKVHCLIWTDS